MIKTEGIFAQYNFFDAVGEYFSSPIEMSLKSLDIIIKVFYLIQMSRKRTLQKLNESIEAEH